MFRHHVILAASIFALALTGIGCESDDDGATDAGTSADSGAGDGGQTAADLVGSCGFGSIRCTDVYVETGITISTVYPAMSASCASRGGNPSASACLTASVFGTCTGTGTLPLPADAGTVDIVSKDRIYGTPSTDPKVECEGRGGTWQAN